MPVICKIRNKEEKLAFIACEGIMTTEDFNVFTTFFNNQLNSPNKFKVFLDLRKLDNVSMTIIKSLSKYMLESEITAINKVLATSVLVDKPYIEYLVKMLFAVKTPITPTKITSDINIACDFLASPLFSY